MDRGEIETHPCLPASNRQCACDEKRGYYDVSPESYDSIFCDHDPDKVTPVPTCEDGETLVTGKFISYRIGHYLFIETAMKLQCIQ